jgi:hypothetical protein
MGGAGAPLSAKFAMGQVFRIVRFSQKKYDPKKYRIRPPELLSLPERGWNYFGLQC